jgi:hypothetical protein
MKRRKSPKKPRSEYLIATTKGEVSEISVSVSPDGRLRFGTEMIDARIEATYDRPKKPKVVHSIGIEPDRMYFGANRALLANYDCVFAVDTNTRELHDHRVSLTAAVEVLATQVCGQVLFEPRFFVECLDVESKPEQLGWMVAAGIINRSPGYQAIKKSAFVVDCDETNIRAYNARTLAPHRTKMLPERVTLVQATTDTGGEYLPNAVLKYADYIGTTVLRDIASGRIPMNTERVPPGLGYVAVRTMSVTRLPDRGHRSRAGRADFRLTVKVPRLI